MDGADKSTELAARRTGMAFQRTRMSAERTLMSVIRTSLSLISFGFTISQFFRHLEEQELVRASNAPRNFGEALIWLGVGMNAVGIVFHVQFMVGLRRARESMRRDELIYGESTFPISYTLVVAILLLMVGIAAIVSVATRRGPFF